MVKQHFSTTVSENLPPLSWMMTMSEGFALLETGNGVDTHAVGSAQYAFEGAWDGPLEDYGFSEAENFFGSGVSVVDGRITFSTATHTLDSLYVFLAAERILVSNSLAFIYQRAGLRLMPGSGIFAREMSIIKGHRKAVRVLHEDAVGRLERLAACNFEIVNGAIQTQAKALAPDFDSFKMYRAYMSDRVARILANAADPARKRSYAPLTTISTGYDSTAGAVIAAENGCKNALTVESERYGANDSGAEIADMLSLTCTALPRSQAQDSLDMPQAEFVASGCGGDAVMVGMAPYLRGAIVTTGYHGGRIWDLHHTPSDDMVRADPSGSGLTEFRLREDFIHAPLPFMAAPRHESLLQIGRSEEMADYRLGGSYDRPIPRRIVEEAGVPRHAFGQHKRAILFILSGQERLLAPAFQSAVDQLLRARLSSAQFWRGRLQRVPRVLLSGTWKLGSGLSKLGRGTVLSKAGKAISLGAARLDARYEHAVPFTAYDDALLITAVEKIAVRYGAAAREQGGA